MRVKRVEPLPPSLSLSVDFLISEGMGFGKSLCVEKGKKSADRRKGRVGDANSAFNKVSHGCHLNTVAYSLFSSRLAIIEEESESREREEKKIKEGRKGGRKMERGERRRG